MARTPDPLDGWVAIDPLALRDADAPINCAVAAWMSLKHSGAFVAYFRDLGVNVGERGLYATEHHWLAFIADGVRASRDGWPDVETALRWANGHLAGVR